MQTELKYRGKTALKCEQNKNDALFISSLFEMQLSSNSNEEKMSLSVEQKNQSLVISAENKNSLKTKSLWALCDKTGVLSRKDTLVNQSKEQVAISGALATFTFAPGEYEVYSETSEWCCENQGKWQDVTTTGVTLKNREARTTEGGTPYICLRERSSGAGVIFHIIPRGNWIIKLRTDSYATAVSPKIILELGLSDENLSVKLAADAAFELPEILIQALPEKGMASAASALHQYALNHLLNTDVRKTKNTSQPPVVYNTWFDCFDRLEGDRLKKQLAVAKETGCDVFAIDAGWYGGADISWHLQVGDWRENQEKAFKGKMVEFSEEVRNAGLGFGLWMEPERLGKNVPILKEHPEWFLPGDDECFYPDLTLSEVYDYTLSEISRLIETYQLVWMKVDFNFKLGIDPSGAEFANYYVKWYQLLDELKEKYPSLFFEGCASGAMRLDLNTLSHFDGHFLSDNTNPWDMLRISQSALLRLPPGKITRWAVLRNIGKNAPIYGSGITFEDRLITPSGNGATWNDFESVDFDFAILATLPGILGVSGDISSFSKEQKAKLKKYISFYKEWREFISNSSAEFLTPIKPIKDRNGWIAFQLTNPGYSESLLFVYRLNSTDDTLSLKLHGINKNKTSVLKKVLDDENVNSTPEISEYGDITIALLKKNNACCYIINQTTASRELVKKAIHFKGPDHLPHYLPDDEDNDLLWLWMGHPEPIQEWTNYGDTDRMIDAWKTTFHRVAGGVLGRGEMLEAAIEDITRQAEYALPDVNNSAYFEDARKAIEANNGSSSPKYCLGVMPFTSLNEGTHNLMGLENMFIAYYEHPDELKAFVKRLAEGQRESIRKLAEIGCDGVMGYDDWGLQDRLMVSPDLIEEFFMSHYRENWALAHELGMDVWLHSCGHIVDVLPKFIDAGLDVIQQDQQENMGLEVLSEKFGGKIAFWCPVDIQNTMINGSLDDIRKYVKKMVDTLGSHNGGLVSMAYSTPADIDHTPEKIDIMCKAFREYGIYK